MKKVNYNQGFTVVESLIALIIFSVAAVALIVLVGGGIANLTQVKLKMQASLLSAEGIELVRSIRDSEKFGGASLSDMLSTGHLLNNCVGASGCTIAPDISSSGIPATTTICPTTGCDVLYRNSTTGIYSNNQADTPTRFVRTITITTDQGAPYEVHILSTVSFPYGTTEQHVSMYEILSDWQQ